METEVLTDGAINEASEEPTGLFDEVANVDGDVSNTATFLQQAFVASHSIPYDANDTMATNKTSPGESLEEGELSEGGAPLPRRHQQSDNLPSEPSEQNQFYSADLPLARDSLSEEYRPLQIEQSAPAANDTDITALRSITSSSASPSTHASMEDSPSLQEDHITSQSLHSAVADTIPESNGASAIKAVANATAALRDDGVDVNFERDQPGSDSLKGYSTALEDVVEQAPDSALIGFAEGKPSSTFSQSEGPSYFTPTTAGDVRTPDTTALGHVTNRTLASPIVSDDDSDLYALSTAGEPAGNVASATLLGTIAGASTVVNSTIDDDTDDDDDFYEPAENTASITPAPVPQSEMVSTSEALPTPAVDTILKDDSESEGVDMDIDESSEADESSNDSSLVVSEIRESSNDLAPELQPPKEEQLTTDQRVNAVSRLFLTLQIRMAKMQLQSPRYEIDRFTTYESPLRSFKAYRFHPQYSIDVPGGFRSMTYSHCIDANKEICPFEAVGGHCNDAKCEYQHFAKMGVTGASQELAKLFSILFLLTNSVHCYCLESYSVLSLL